MTNRGLKLWAKSFFLIHSVILGGGKAFGVTWLHWIEFSESGLNEYVRIPAAAGVGWFTSTESSTAGELGNYLENKNSGEERSWQYNTWGSKPEQFGYSRKGDYGATHARSAPVTHSLVINLESSTLVLSGLLPLLFQVISHSSSFLIELTGRPLGKWC